MPLTKAQKMKLTRCRNSEFYQTFLEEKATSKTVYEEKDENEQLSELELYIRDNKVTLKKASKNTELSIDDYNSLIDKILANTTLTSEEQIERIKKWNELKKIKKSMQEVEEKLNELKQKKVEIENEISAY